MFSAPHIVQHPNLNLLSELFVANGHLVLESCDLDLEKKNEFEDIDTDPSKLKSLFS